MTNLTKIARTLGAAGLALASLAGTAAAEDKFSWSVNIGGTSDYVFRGISQSDEDPAFQAGIDMSYGIFYVGAWGSGVDKEFIGGSPAEVDFYAGIKPVLGPATFDFGVIYYWYPGDENPRFNPLDLEQDYVELKAGVSGSLFKDFAVGFNGYYSSEGTLETGEYFVYEGNAAYTLPAFGKFTPVINGVLGYVDNQDFEDLSYTYWNAGLALTIEKLTLDFRYWDTDIDDFGLADERFVFSAKVVLP